MVKTFTHAPHIPLRLHLLLFQMHIDHFLKREWRSPPAAFYLLLEYLKTLAKSLGASFHLHHCHKCTEAAEESYKFLEKIQIHFLTESIFVTMVKCLKANKCIWGASKSSLPFSFITVFAFVVVFWLVENFPLSLITCLLEHHD